MSAATKEEEYASYEKGCAPLQLILQQALIATAESSPERAFDTVFNADLSAAINFATEVGVSKDEAARVLEVAAEQMRSGVALRRGKRVSSSGEGN